MTLTNTRSNVAFSLAAILIILFSLHSHAQKTSGEERTVETSWVKYALPSGWEMSPTCPPENRHRERDSNDTDYGYWMSSCFIRDPYAYIIIRKLSYPDGSEMTLEEGKRHYTRHTPCLVNCMWLKVSDKELKGLANINDIGYEVANGKINKLERPVNATVFVKKIGNEVYILEIGFDNNRYPTNQQKSITDAVYKSWQPLVKK